MGQFGGRRPVDDRAVYQLPEDHTDFVFVVVAERLGWAGALAALALELDWSSGASDDRRKERANRLAGWRRSAWQHLSACRR